DGDRAKLDQLFGRVRRDVAGTGDHCTNPFQAASPVLEHVFEEVDRAITGRLGPDHGTAVLQALAREDAGKVVDDPLVLTEHVADLARTDSDIAGRHVDVRTDVAIELGHEALAEPHDFAVGLALRIEVRPALSSADGKSGERILEGLL